MASEIRVNKISNRAGLSTVEYTDTGVIVSGIVTCTEISGLNALNIAGVSTFASPLDINGDIDVDGHTNLDNVSVAGVTTFSDNDIFFKNSGITSCRYDSDQGRFLFNHNGGLHWYKNGNLSNSSGASISYSEFANEYKGLVIQAPWQGQNNAKNVTVMGSSNGRFVIQNNLNASEIFRATFEGGVNLGYYQSGTKLQTTTTGIKVGTGVTVETNGQATFTGIVTATSFRGDGSQLTGITAGTSLSGSTNNTVTTVTGANAIQGEANLTFDGDTLLLKSSTDGRRVSFAGDGTSHYMKYDNTLGGIILNGYGGIAFETNGTNERLRITSTGQVLLGATSGGNPDTDDLIVSGSGKRGITVCSTNGSECRLTFADGLSGVNAVAGNITYDHSVDRMDLYTNTTRRVSIDSSGRMLLATTSANHYPDRMFTINRDAGAGIELRNNSTSTGQISFSDTSGSGIGAYRGYIQYQHNNGSMHFATQSTERLRITSSGHVEPVTDDTYNFGSLTKRWANIYTADLNLSNEGKANDVDGTWGQYTIQEGQDDLFLINKRNGKKYMFVLKEVS